MENNFDAARSTYSYDQTRHRRPAVPRRIPHRLLCFSLIPFSLRAPSRRRSCSGTPAGNAEKERTREEHQRGGYRDERGTEERGRYQRREWDGERQSPAEKERRRNREDSSAEGSGKSARERTRGDNFRERGLRGPPRRSAESPSSPGAAARIFLPLSGPLSRPLFFFPPGRRRGARAAFHPRGPRRFFFSSVCAATPPRHNGRVPENSSLGRRPFPRPPRLFRRFPSRLSPLSRAPPSPSASPLALPPMPFFLSLFLSRPPPPLRLHLPPTSTSIRPSTVSVARVFAALFSFAPGVYFKRSLQPAPAPSRGATARYVRSVLYTILEARNVCARLWPGVYTAAV